MRRSRYARYRWTKTYDNNNEPSSTPNLDKLLFWALVFFPITVLVFLWCLFNIHWLLLGGLIYWLLNKIIK